MAIKFQSQIIRIDEYWGYRFRPIFKRVDPFTNL